MTVKILDSTPCALGEGPLWHPENKVLYWFDILGQTMHSSEGGIWKFREPASAAGWVNDTALLVATASNLMLLNLKQDKRQVLLPLEEEKSRTRSNDGRADPQGGFWIGTMGRNGEPDFGAIYRYYNGELRKLVPSVSIPNAICFAPCGTKAYYADTPKQVIWRVALDEDGWPEGMPSVFVDLRGTDFMPDGAVVDANGILWNAQWGAGRVAAYSPEGTFLQAIELPAPQATCPAFGGAELRTLYCTSAQQGMDASALASHPFSGQTFDLGQFGPGQAEYRVLL